MNLFCKPISDQEFRDISSVRLIDGKWSRPQTIFEDNWQINGCPVNGPSVTAAGRNVAVAWYTGVNEKPRVKLAFSNDAGATFGEPVVVDEGNPVGRVETVMLDDGAAFVCWLERVPGGGQVRLRRVQPDGRTDSAVVISDTGTARSNGFPQIVRSGDTLVFAWTGKRVMTALLPLVKK